MRSTNCRLRLFCLLVFFLSFTFVQAQSKKAKEELTEADYSFAGKKYEEARTVYLKHAQHLSPKQQLQLGISYFSMAKENPAALTTGIDWIQKSADAGYTEAMNTLSYLYSIGTGVAKDSVQEMQWLVRSADAGDAAALATLGNRYQMGKGVENDKAKAKDLYYKAANKGSKEAAYQLGSFSLDERNLSSALYYLKQSAKDEYLPAMLKLAEIYEKGTGLGSKDPDEAVRWYTKIKNTDGFTNYHSKAYDGIRRIGNAEPSTDLASVKPKLLQLVGKAGTGFSGLLSQTVEPLDRRSGFGSILSEDTYYTCTVDLGFKNALIKKEVVKDRDLGNGYRTRAGTFYTYTADIVHSTDEATANRVFEKWKTVLQEAIPQWKGKEDKDPNNSAPNFILSGTMTSGTKVTIYMGLCCPANSQKTVYLRISSE
ncbi:sel1 repeat family protein [Flavisolibacter sp. BT320]|nr:sel1 repeat family protein [Flavisolibacter longurius]